MKTKLNDALGASMIEAALTIALFLILVLACIDFARYFYATLVLNYAAYSIVDAATKQEVEVDSITRSGVCDQAPSDPADACDEYINRVQANLTGVIQGTAMLAARSSAASAGGIQLGAFEHYYADAYPAAFSGLRAFTADAAFLRPGEKVRRVRDGSELQHSIAPYGSGTEPNWPQRGSSWSQVLDQQPLEVVIEADFYPVTFLLPKLRIQARQHGFRRTREFGLRPPPALTLPPDLPPTATPLPTPTPDPDSTPDVYPTPTPNPQCAVCDPPCSSSGCNLPCCIQHGCQCPGTGD